ncbi:MAG: CDP-diacylglycerol--glycerol-3-phosphate 3-phosphatidyltransferase [Rhodospirillales bacterium]|nr:CDP-diacylglycerol--glycerol-3-phosphate 3-phosphatidyltransferase [Rhodospirillales bacterium]
MEANLPNALTISRILATPVVCLLLFVGTTLGSWLALAVWAYACLTDFLDGYLARTWQQQSNFGRMLDPIADKLLVASVLLVLVGADRLIGASILPAGVILCREILVSGLREFLAQVQVRVPVSRLAKWKTSIQMVAIGFLVVGDAGPRFGPVTPQDVGIYGLWAAAALTLVTGYDYLRAGLTHMGAESAVGENRPASSTALDHVEQVREGR